MLASQTPPCSLNSSFSFAAISNIPLPQPYWPTSPLLINKCTLYFHLHMAETLTGSGLSDTAVRGSQWGCSKLRRWNGWEAHHRVKNKKQSRIWNKYAAFWLSQTPPVPLENCFNCYSSNVTLKKCCNPWPLLRTVSRGERIAKAYMQRWMS